MQIKNVSNKIIGIGELTLLPGDLGEVPVGYEENPTLELYKEMKMVEISGNPKKPAKTAEEIEEEEKAAKEKAAQEAEELRQSRLASLKGISDGDLFELAKELGINPAECKDQEDVLKKVKAALKK